MSSAEPGIARRTLSQPSFQVGMVVMALLCTAFLVQARRLHQLVESLDARFQDFVYWYWRGPQEPTGQVVIVDVDERSLVALGQWPWPRSTLAELVRAVGSCQPKVIGFDMVFSEPDRTSLKLAAERIAALTGTAPELPEGSEDNDAILADALAETAVVLGYFFELPTPGATVAPASSTGDLELPCPEFSIPVAPGDRLLARSALPVARRATLNLPCLNDSALSEGFFNTLPDNDGITRRGSLFIQFGNSLYPSLALEMAREGLGADPELLRGPFGELAAVRFGDGRPLRVTRQGQIVINFRGPPRTFTTVSAVDVLRGTVDAAVFRDRYVLVGTSAIGLLDLRATPVAQVFPGVEINANLLDNILAADPLTYDKVIDIGATFVLLLFCGTVLVAVLATFGPRTGALAAAAIILLVVYGNYRIFFLNRQLVGITFLVAALTILFLTVSVANHFFEGRRKRFIQSAFSLYVSEGVVNTLLRRPEMLRLDGEEKELSVLFTDIRGFTSISESMSPKQLSLFLNEYLSAMTDVIMGHGGTVDKFIGDAIMAFWGAPLDAPDHAARGVRASLGMRARLAELQPDWAARGLPAIAIGVGINSGTMRVGNMGSTTRFDYTVMGDNVNLASRLEGLTKIYGAGILVTEATRRAAGDAFVCRPIDLVRVKGRKEPVALFEPLAEGQTPPAWQTVLPRWQEAVNLYRARQFAAARNLIGALNAEHGETLYALYLDRIEHFLETPPPEDWDGVTTFTTKGHEDG